MQQQHAVSWMLYCTRQAPCVCPLICMSTRHTGHAHARTTYTWRLAQHGAYQSNLVDSLRRCLQQAHRTSLCVHAHEMFHQRSQRRKTRAYKRSSRTIQRMHAHVRAQSEGKRTATCVRKRHTRTCMCTHTYANGTHAHARAHIRTQTQHTVLPTFDHLFKIRGTPHRWKSEIWSIWMTCARCKWHAEMKRHMYAGVYRCIYTCTCIYIYAYLGNMYIDVYTYVSMYMYT